MARTPLVVDTNGDFIADSAYAGDLKGNYGNLTYLQEVQILGLLHG